MYKKLMFLISLVCLLALSGKAFADDPGDADAGWWILDGESVLVDVGENVVLEKGFFCQGTLTIKGTLTCLGADYRPSISGDPEGANEGIVIVDGGTLNLPVRLNMGTKTNGDDTVGNSSITIINGGLVHQWDGGGKDSDEGIKFPDDEGGVNRIYVLDGELIAYSIEYKDDRDAQFILGCPSEPGEIVGKITTGDCGDSEYDPVEWEGNGHLNCDPCNPCPSAIVVINDLPDDGDWEDRKETYCFIVPPQAYGPSPQDGATKICPDVCLTWVGGQNMGDYPSGDKHYVFFGECPNTCVAEIGDDEYVGFKLFGSEEYCPPDLELWHTYCWRIDEKPFGQSTVPGDCWSFTTGCEIMPGDISLDCFVNGTDFAMLADDWMVTSFFPDDF